MWTAHNQIEEKWDYIRAYDAGYFDAKIWPSKDEAPAVNDKHGNLFFNEKPFLQ